MFAKAILVGALAAVAAAQSSVLTFTRVPNPMTGGQPQTITYATNDTSSPVTILLLKGVSTHLETLSTLTTDARHGQFTFTISESIESDSDYALEIKQGTQINYYGPLSIQSGDASSSSPSSSSFSSSSSASASITSASNTTLTTAPISAGTGTSMSRNVTLSSATLTASDSSSHTTGPTSSNAGAGFQTTTTGASASQTTNAAPNLAHGSSAVALVFGAIAAVLYV